MAKLDSPVPIDGPVAEVIGAVAGAGGAQGVLDASVGSQVGVSAAVDG